jgi:hypothetical protein
MTCRMSCRGLPIVSHGPSIPIVSTVAMNAGQGPDLHSVCEVENRFVVDRLIERVNATLAASTWGTTSR